MQNIKMLVEKARQMTLARIKLYPKYGVYIHALEQIERIASILESKGTLTKEEIDNVDIGIMAVRELDASEPDYADCLMALNCALKNDSSPEVSSKLSDYIEIKSAQKLRDLIEDLKGHLDKKIIVKVAGNCDLQDFGPYDLWPVDVIHVVFKEIQTGFHFELNCETYHGAGGSFQRIQKRP